jgi:N-acetyl-anhydromuramyl-L-alanine amidase AmpD
MATSDGWYPQAKRLPITTDEFTEPRGDVLTTICNHISDGTDSRGWLQNADNQSSVHFLIRLENGKGVVYQFMSVNRAAWGNGRHSGTSNPYMPAWLKAYITRGGNPNNCTVSIEHERKWPFTTTLPDPMLKASIELHKWLTATYPTIIVDRDHVIGHYQIDHVQRAHCPGGPGGKLFPFDTIIAALKPVQPQPRPTVPTPTPNPDAYIELNGFYLGGAIRRYWEEHGGVGVFGLPLENEQFGVTLEDGRPYTVQLFEYEMLAWRIGEQVRKVRLGAMYKALKEAT